MASSENYLNYVLELLSSVENVSYKKMMGEYLLYKGGKLFGGIYDDRFLIKKTKSVEKYRFPEEFPYDGAKSMYLIDEEDGEKLKTIIDELLTDLK